MNQITAWLDGKKTNLISAWAFAGALYMVMNDIGDDQISALLATVATIAAAMRASNAKIAKAILPLVIGCLFAGGLVACASLGTIDPSTGTSPAQDITKASGSIASVFGPAVGTAVPLIVGGILSVIVALGKTKEPA